VLWRLSIGILRCLYPSIPIHEILYSSLPIGAIALLGGVRWITESLGSIADRPSICIPIAKTIVFVDI
jgi:hypothetical protein